LRPSRRLLVLGLMLGAILRAWLITLPGTTDVVVWKVWSFAASTDVTGVYGVGGTPPERRVLHWRGEAMTVDYPPLSLHELAIAGRVYRILNPSFEDGRALNVLMKLPGLIAELVMVLVFYRFARREYDDRIARLGAMLLWLNPALLLNGTALGYLDLQMAVPLTLALLAAWRHDGVTAGILLALAVLTKAQAVFVLPVIFATLLWRSAITSRLSDLIKVTCAGIATASLVVAPFLFRGAWTNLAQALSRLAAQDMLSANAANVWWLVTWWLRVRDVWTEWGPLASLTQETRILTIDRAIALGYPNPRLLGLALVSVAIVWACARMRRASSLATAFALAAWTMHAYALFATQVHENHLTPAVVLLAPAAAINRGYRGVFVALTCVVTMNLYLFYGLGEGFPPVVSRAVTGIDATVLLSVASLASFTWLTRLIAREVPRAVSAAAVSQ
jgi:hypothetical protein